MANILKAQTVMETGFSGIPKETQKNPAKMLKVETNILGWKMLNPFSCISELTPCTQLRVFGLGQSKFLEGSCFSIGLASGGSGN